MNFNETVEKKFDKVVDSVTEYIYLHPEAKNKEPYEIYNDWAIKSGTIIKNVGKVQWIMNYIGDLKSIPQSVLKNTISKKEEFKLA